MHPCIHPSHVVVVLEHTPAVMGQEEWYKLVANTLNMIYKIWLWTLKKKVFTVLLLMHFNFSIIPFYVYWGVFILLFLFQKKWFEKFLHCLCFSANWILFFGIADVQWQHGGALFRTVASQQDGRRFQSVAKLKKLFIKLYRSRDGRSRSAFWLPRILKKQNKKKQ